MKKYVEHLEIQNFNEIDQKINDWKKTVLKNANVGSQLWKKHLVKIFYIIGSLFLVIGIIISIVTAFSNTPFEEQNYITPQILWVLGVVVFLIGIFINYLYKKSLSKRLQSAILESNINPYTLWINETNQNISGKDVSKLFPKNYESASNVDEFAAGLKKYNDNLSPSNINDYKDLKYNMSGANSVGLSKEYDLYNGVIFNNPFSLFCGVWHSKTTIQTKDTYNVVDYYDYLPLLKIETNLFTNNVVRITNSKYFSDFTKKDIQLEDDEFNKKFSITSNDENAVRMILTPIVQNKWKEIEHLPPFNMVIKNGYITILFKTNSNFMDMDKIAELSAQKFKNVNVTIWNDIKAFLNILTLIFSVSIFQFEEIQK